MNEIEQAAFELKVLGGFQVTRGGAPVDLPSRKLACLLTYLAMTAPVRQPRERLAGLLWGRGGEERARHNLRQAIARLRRTLGSEVILSDGDAITLADGSFICDAVVIDRMTADREHEAAALYRGTLLQDVFVNEALWSDWLVTERERLSDRAIGAIVRQAETLLAAGQREDALRDGRRAVALNPFREDAHRLILKGLTATGRLAEASKHYQDLCAFLRSELGSEPDDETRHLIGRLGEGSLTAPLPQAQTSALPKPDSAALEGGSARRMVTLIACDVGANDGDRNPSVDAVGTLAADVARRFGGEVLGTSQGVVEILFGGHAAREDHALQAARAGQALVAAAGQGRRIRAGMASATVTFDPASEGPAMDKAADEARQVLLRATPGSVAISHEARRLLADRFDLAPILDEAVSPAWRIVQEASPDTQRMSAPLIGRQEEVDLLRRRWTDARAGRGQVVLVSGEAGIGKSRLAEDLLRDLQSGGATRLRYHCLELHENRPLHPYIAQIEWSGGIAPGQAAAEKLERLTTLVAGVSSDSQRDTGLMAEFLDLPRGDCIPALDGTPQQKREMTIAAFLEWLGNLASRGPVAMLFEDLHWIDPSSLELLDRTIAMIPDLPVMIVATMRPEFQPDWIGQPEVTMLHLSRLGRTDSAAVVTGIARADTLPASLIEGIVDRADGVPLFLRELTRQMVDDDPHVRLSTGPTLQIPTTLHSSLMARLEPMGPDRDVALMAATIGRACSHEMLCAVTGWNEAALTASLERLVAAGLLARRGALPEARYQFRHALIQDAAYAMMSDDRRRELHGRIADVLMTQDEDAAVLAHHLSRASRRAEAAQYWLAAGRAARKRWANREAADLFDLAIAEISDRTDAGSMRQAVDLRFEIKTALMPLGAFDRIIGRLLEARDLIDRLGDPRRHCRFLIHMCQALSLSGKLSEAIRFGEDARDSATALGDERQLVEAELLLGTARISCMDHEGAEQHLLLVLRRLEHIPQGTQSELAGQPELTAGAFLTHICAVRGEFERGRVYAERTIARASELGQPYSQSIALWCLANLHLTRGDLSQAIPRFEEGLALARKWDLPFLTAGHAASITVAHSLLNGSHADLAPLEEAVAIFDAMRHRLALSLFLVPLARANLLAGRIEQARKLAERAWALAVENGFSGGEADSRHVLAEIAVRELQADEALAHFNAALSHSEHFNLRPLTARCHHGLGDLMLDVGKPDLARTSYLDAMRVYRDIGMDVGLEQCWSSFEKLA